MAVPNDPQKNERPSTYFVQDRHNEEELHRLTIQDQMLTASMGGVLPEQPDPASFHRVLDIGCGSGSWAIEAAQIYPQMSLVGIDISQRMIDYARSQAELQHVSERVEFRVMDALLLLEFPRDYFDLVNLRLGISFMRTWDWSKLISEMLRVTRYDGIVRLTDEEIVTPCNSPALMQLQQMLVCSGYKAGHLFETETTGLAAHIARLLTQYGGRQVQTQAYALAYRAGTPEGQYFADDMAHVFHTSRPFLQKWGCEDPNYEALYEQSLAEMQRPDFHATWNFVTAWGLATA